MSGNGQQLAPVAPGQHGLAPASISAEAEAFITSIGSRHVAKPRNHELILRSLKQFAAVAGDRFYYEYPVNTKNDGKKIIRGPSIKLANALLLTYGNCGCDTKVVETGDSWVFSATFVDAEQGAVLRRLFRQRRSQQSIRTDDQARQEDIAFQIGQSKAIRNVVVNALSTYVDYAMDCAREGLLEKVKANPGYARDKIAARLAEYEIDKQRVVKWVGRAESAWRPEDLVKIVAALQAVAEGMAKPEDIWGKDAPPPAPPGPGQQGQPPSQPAPGEQGQPPSAPAAPQQPAAPAEKKSPAAIADELIKAFEDASDQQLLEDVWNTRDNDIQALPEDLFRRVTAAYDAVFDKKPAAKS